MMKIFNPGDRKGSVLLMCYIVIISFTILGGAFLLRSVGEKNIAQKEKEQSQAFYLAQAGVMRAIYQLRKDYNWSGTTTGQNVNLILGEYRVSVEAAGEKRRIVADGFVPNSASSSAHRSIEVFVERKDLPANFFDNTLYVSGDVDANGNAFTISAKDGSESESAILYDQNAELDVEHPENVVGTSSSSDISPLVRLNFSELRQLSGAQGNIYDAYRLTTDFLPDTYWYTRADNGVDDDGDSVIDEEDEWVPNIVYVEADLILRGNIGTIGGFFVVVGDVVTNPSVTQDTTINGNGMIEGCLYTTGEFRINGGGQFGLNVNGGVWAGLEVTLNGNVDISYNTEYMDALRGLCLDPDLQILSWQELL